MFLPSPPNQLGFYWTIQRNRRHTWVICLLVKSYKPNCILLISSEKQKNSRKIVISLKELLTNDKRKASLEHFNGTTEVIGGILFKEDAYLIPGTSRKKAKELAVEDALCNMVGENSTPHALYVDFQTKF
uniref:Uncharacterized protein n=1 Tax=Lactuca sativa TaxID=4236 RepID=A0A9R1WK90_LACSA|nr:hypothetical protein LSAT_V11C100000820 [Lactuca sativa]